MRALQIDDSHALRFRDTPWNERVLGVPTREITELRWSDRASLERLVDQFNELSRAEGVGLVITRCDAEDRDLILAMQMRGFAFVEASYLIGLALKSTYEPPPEFRKAMPLREARLDDRAAIEAIAEGAFRYGRLLEDPRIPQALSRTRHRNWVRDLFDQGHRGLVFESKGRIVSFMFFSQDSEQVELILGGSDGGLGLSSVYFWVALLERFKAERITRVTTLISAANLGVLNLYARLGFKVERLLIGLHQHLRPITG